MRFNYNLLNNRIAQVCGSQQEFARRLGISFEELQEKLDCKDYFTISEIEKGVTTLNAPPTNISKLFFEKR